MEENNEVPGRDAGEKSKFGQGTMAQKGAAEEAVEKGHDSEPY